MLCTIKQIKTFGFWLRSPKVLKSPTTMEGMPNTELATPFHVMYFPWIKNRTYIFGRRIIVISGVELPIILSNSLLALSVRFFTSGRFPIFSTPFFTPPKNVSQPSPTSAKITRTAKIRTIHPINKKYFR